MDRTQAFINSDSLTCRAAEARWRTKISVGFDMNQTKERHGRRADGILEGCTVPVFVGRHERDVIKRKTSIGGDAEESFMTRLIESTSGRDNLYEHHQQRTSANINEDQIRGFQAEYQDEFRCLHSDLFREERPALLPESLVPRTRRWTRGRLVGTQSHVGVCEEAVLRGNTGAFSRADGGCATSGCPARARRGVPSCGPASCRSPVRVP